MAEKELVQIGGRDVTLTRPDKVLFPEPGYTKRDLVGYYRQVAPWILPHLQDRPLMLERYPDGLGGPVLVQKDISKYYPDWIARFAVKKKGGSVRHVICNDEATLAYLANQACITPHTWLSRTDDIDCPDQLVFDLDPSDEDFAAVKTTAKAIRTALDAEGLPAFLKTSGSRGLHIVVPLKPRAHFGEIRELARTIAVMVIREEPDHRTLEVAKANRHGRIYLDINRNAYAQNVAPAWAVRARPTAPVSVPIEWSELARKSLRPDGWTIRTAFKRIESDGDPWKDFWRHAA